MKENLLALYRKAEFLFDEARSNLTKDENYPGLYDWRTNMYLRGNGNSNQYEVEEPLPREQWPSIFDECFYGTPAEWPNYNMFNYCNDVVAPPCIRHELRAGYAMYEERFVKVHYFSVIVFDKEDNNFPRNYAVDPLANEQGIVPDGYIGVTLPREYIEKACLDGYRSIIPLSLYAEMMRKKNDQAHREKVECSKTLNHAIQMAYSPEIFHPDQIEFAKDNNLYVPPQSR